ncbi:MULTISPECIES: TetR/AcrR family transcriptional regulator [unclassified Actinomyces]|uniref:TetR/AcrR family transcriptional regulator n=1 Tax=unclassified Actinomyces TaxID=2609248 RepID=UPI00135A329D|nr:MULTISPECIES: TetR/AcrR family transcriptional regulator [unclassified Actinomyces]
MESSAPRGGGRPRDPRIDGRILTAAARLMASGGLGALRADALATAAGVPKSTIYRRWGTLLELAVDAVDAALGPRRLPATEEPLADLATHVQRAHTILATPPLGPAVIQIAHELLGRPEAAASYRQRVIAPLRDGAIDAVSRAIKAGQWDGPEAVLSIDMVIGTVLYRLTYLGIETTLEEAFELVETIAGRPLPRPS